MLTFTLTLMLICVCVVSFPLQYVAGKVLIKMPKLTTHGHIRYTCMYANIYTHIFILLQTQINMNPNNRIMANK